MARRSSGALGAPTDSVGHCWAERRWAPPNRQPCSARRRVVGRMKSPPREFGLVGFDHVDLRVRDLAKARRFFVEQLGMEVLGDAEDHTYLLFGDQVLGLHLAKDGEPVGGVDHIALRVSEWTGLKSRVQRARVVITGEKERQDSRSLYLRGPAGIKIELVWRPDPSAHALDQAPCLPGRSAD